MKIRKIGFLGLGIMGQPMAKNLLEKGFDLVVWNRDSAKCLPLVEAGAVEGASPAEVVDTTDVTFAMLADPAAAESVFFRPDGVFEGMKPGKAFVDFSTVDEFTSRNIAQAVTEAGGRFLEAPVSGSKQPAENGQLIILAAGDRTLFQQLEPAFSALAKKSVFLGEVGQGARMKLVVNMIMGGMMGAFCEGLALGEKCGLNADGVVEILQAGAMSNPMFAGKGAQIMAEDFSPAFPLKHMHKDLRLAVELAAEMGQSLDVSSTALNVFQEAMEEGLGDDDFSAVAKTVSK
jgi:3-hydroxyisobutyrate dehydrogenase-like beta-hydroxyacid dehydrogenase